MKRGHNIPAHLFALQISDVLCNALICTSLHSDHRQYDNVSAAVCFPANQEIIAEIIKQKF